MSGRPQEEIYGLKQKLAVSIYLRLNMNQTPACQKQLLMSLFHVK